ncbi:MAG: MtrB/PioB family decaheme-associated outer membrane protein [Candidatus Latescibacteria bacterium]|nr:MtrB/PioB family decaheme-associated outer membrane protein [Candidatus Latescibacterota bacterium]
MNAKHLASTLIVLTLALGGSSDLAAQTSTGANAVPGEPPRLFGLVTGADVELGGRRIGGTLNSSKFTEYRDLATGMYTDAFSLGLMNPEHTSALSFSGAHVGQRDQHFAAQLARRGVYKVEVEWDQLPHNYTNTARTVFSGSGTGQLEMPSLVRNRIRTILTTDLDTAATGVQFDTSAIAGLVLGTARGIDVVSRREKGKASVSYSPNENLDVNLSYSNEKRSGTKPLGGNFGFNVVELIEPTDYRTQEAGAGVEYTAKRWNLQLNYSASIFDNNIDALVWDNPFNEIDAVGTSSRGRLGLYPNNTANNLSLAGAASLPYATRLMATLARGWRRQDDSFIPYTINAALDTVANYPTLPAASLDGKVGTTLVNLSVTNRFFRSVWLTARYRTFDYDNQTRSLIFPAYVGYDGNVTRVRRSNPAIAHKKANASLDATVRLVPDVSLKVGYESENWDRENRDAEKTEESIYRASLDYVPRSWLLVRTSYSVGAKKTPHYDAEELVHVLFPDGEPPRTLGQIPQLRKFDLATRDRNKANVLAQVTPFEALTLSGSFGLVNDDFKESQYGLLSNKANNLSLDAAYNPTYDLALFANYTKETFKYAMKSRQRVPETATAAVNDTVNNDWRSNMKDGANTFGLGLSWAAVPEKVDLSADFSLSSAKGTSATKALGDPTIKGFLVTSAEDYPDTKSKLTQLRTSIGYRLTPHFTPRVEYRFEDYNETYFNQDVMEPYMAPVDPTTAGAVFLGARQPGYSAHIVSLVWSYTF